MGVDFFLACDDCHEFIDLHKWPVVENAGRFLVHAHYKTRQYTDQFLPEDLPYPLADLDSMCKKVLITAKDLEAALGGEVPDQPYIRELATIVRAFATWHRGHRLFLSCDLGDPEEDPWWPGRPRFAEWKEIPGPFLFYRYLPRNMIEVDGFESWAEAVEKLREEWPFVYGSIHSAEIESIHAAFEEGRSRRWSRPATR
jgi:hypothetical protein